MAGKVIVGLPLHWPCTQRLQWFIHIIGKGMSLYSAHGIWAAHFTFFTVIVPRSAMALRDKYNTLGLLLSWKLRYMLHKMLVYVASLTVLLRNDVPIGRRAVDMRPYTTHWTQLDWLTALSDTGRSSPLCRERPSVLFPVTGEVQRAEARGSKGRQRDGVFGEREASYVSTRYGVRERCKLPQRCS